MKKSPVSLLLLLGLAANCFASEGKKMNKKVYPQAEHTGSPEDRKRDEEEKMRLIYLRLHPEYNIVATPHPRYALHWRSLPEIHDVTDKQIQAAQKRYQEYVVKLDRLTQKRNSYLEKHWADFKELEALISHLQEFRKKHEAELMKIMKEYPGNEEIFQAQIEAARSWNTLDGLRWMSEQEHNQMYHGPWEPTFLAGAPGSAAASTQPDWFPAPNQPTAADVTKMAKGKPVIQLEPGATLNEKSKSPYNLTPTPIFNVSTSKPRKDKTITRYENISPDDSPSMFFGGMTGMGDKANKYMHWSLSVSADAKPGSKTCIVAQHADGTFSVLFTVVVKQKSSAAESGRK